jgi:hypothetical protein
MIENIHRIPACGTEDAAEKNSGLKKKEMGVPVS